MPTFLLTPAQQQTIANYINTDPKNIGFASHIPDQDVNGIYTMLSCIQDGVTPDPVTGVIDGPSGTITSTSAATPVVVTTSAPHGLATNDSVLISGNSQAVANGYFTVTVLSTTTFSIATPGNLAAIAGTGAGTGGTFQWCVAGVRAQSISSSLVWEVLNKSDEVGGSSALTGLQQEDLALVQGLLNQPSGQVQFSTSSGADTNELGMIKALFNSGSGTITALTALKYRLGSIAEFELGISNPITYKGNTGVAPTTDDIQAAMGWDVQ